MSKQTTFQLKAIPFLLTFILCMVMMACNSQSENALSISETQKSSNLDIEHVLLDKLGGERKKNAAYRLTSEGEERIISWGYRILEWTLDPSESYKLVFPEEKGLWYSNGGTVMDVNGNGGEELIVARNEVDSYAREDNHYYEGDLEHVELLWYEPLPGKETWEAHRIAIIEESAPHDIQPFYTESTEGEIKGVMVLLNRQILTWFEIPDDPMKSWKRHDIITLPETGQSGLTIGDISGDGLPDIITGMFWVESPADPVNGTWEAHRFGLFDDRERGGMAKHLLADFDGDGQKDLIVTEAEKEDARMGLFNQNPDDPYGLWDLKILDSTLYAPHSIVAKDLTGSGYKDVIVGEMTAGGWNYPLQDNPKIYVFWNEGNSTFRKDILVEGWGVHEMKLIERLDGTTMIYSADEIQPHKIDGMETHVSYWLLH